MRTNKCTRSYIDRIIQIRDEVEALNAEKRRIARKLGFGTYRSRNFIGRLVRFRMGSGGWRVTWKDVARGLADQLNMTDAQFTASTHGHRTRTHSSPSVTVTTDKAKCPRLDNPNIHFI